MTAAPADPPPRPAKIFCIGRNKTGTTSLGAALQSLGFRLGSQERGERLLDDWAARRFDRIVSLARTAEAFQDVPFSLPFTYQALDVAFPGAKFILTVRSSPEEWLRSFIRFHSQRMGTQGPPTAADLKAYAYRYPGYVWKSHRLVFRIDERSLYDPAIYKAHYERHNAAVIDYFAHRPGYLLVVNLAQADAEARIAAFVGRPGEKDFLPHLNRSA